MWQATPSTTHRLRATTPTIPSITWNTAVPGTGCTRRGSPCRVKIGAVIRSTLHRPTTPEGRDDPVKPRVMYSTAPAAFQQCQFGEVTRASPNLPPPMHLILTQRMSPLQGGQQTPSPQPVRGPNPRPLPVVIPRDNSRTRAHPIPPRGRSVWRRVRPWAQKCAQRRNRLLASLPCFRRRGR